MLTLVGLDFLFTCFIHSLRQFVFENSDWDALVRMLTSLVSIDQFFSLFLNAKVLSLFE